MASIPTTPSHSSPSAVRYPALFAFDFDWTLVDEDTDRYVFGQISPPTLEKLYAQHKTKQWTDLMDELHTDLHTLRIPSSTILSTWASIPFHASTQLTLRTLSSLPSTTCIIISDSNTLAINAILTHHGLTDVFGHVATNPAHVTGDDKVKVERLMREPHGCGNGCAVNICKGKVLREYIQQHGPFETVVYAGDGKNDFCAAVHLRSTDYILPRTGHALAKLLAPPPTTTPNTTTTSTPSDTESPSPTLSEQEEAADPIKHVPAGARERVCAQMRFWESGDDLLRVVRELTGTGGGGDTAPGVEGVKCRVSNGVVATAE
ncbi:putative phosphatase-domain-containing protein [Powellomyces hirtus]|nr:putative phosphatase-domain-containing protein [Powellomyces hirtus]